MEGNKKEIIESLERACDIFDRIQERKAVIKAEEIVSESIKSNWRLK